MKEFKGRVVTPGTVTAEAVVTKSGFNTLASFQNALQFGDKEVKCGDQNNAELYGKSLLNKALCKLYSSLFKLLFKILIYFSTFFRLCQ